MGPVGPVGPVGSVGSVGSQATPSLDISIEQEKIFWKKLLQEVNGLQKTYGRIVLLYNPRDYPTLKEGTAVLTSKNAHLAQEFMALAKEQGIAVLDMRPIFLRYFHETGQFPTGFSNSFPGKGHWNNAGHKLVAQAVYDFLKVQPDAKGMNQ